jgi:hypothetical protein
VRVSATITRVTAERSNGSTTTTTITIGSSDSHNTSNTGARGGNAQCGGWSLSQPHLVSWLLVAHVYAVLRPHVLARACEGELAMGEWLGLVVVIAAGRGSFVVPAPKQLQKTPDILRRLLRHLRGNVLPKVAKRRTKGAAAVELV